MTKRTRKPNFMTELMNEHIALPGAPGIVVTRHEAVTFLKKLGYPNQGGFGSIDYMVFGPRQKALDVPLTDAVTRDRMFAYILKVELGNE